jgi:hypothetical protein
VEDESCGTEDGQQTGHHQVWPDQRLFTLHELIHVLAVFGFSSMKDPGLVVHC